MEGPSCGNTNILSISSGGIHPKIKAGCNHLVTGFEIETVAFFYNSGGINTRDMGVVSRNTTITGSGKGIFIVQ